MCLNTRFFETVFVHKKITFTNIFVQRVVKIFENRVTHNRRFAKYKQTRRFIVAL
jgi:hypothetical protein